MSAAAAPPGIQLGLQGVDPRHVPARKPPHRKTLGSFPALCRARIAVQVASDLLPGIQALTRYGWRDRACSLHGARRSRRVNSLNLLFSLLSEPKLGNTRQRRTCRLLSRLGPRGRWYLLIRAAVNARGILKRR